ncbi:hypothetical protein [Pseudovibrio sp. Tun.PSC04-5.I4]|uniref:hypothetical protein n=1 Tax=Pseudovibrio sp. Tun.PSC04-5.I4 TaxID=1798213 RepID=UPI0008885DF4|nr:hypothetical protein [Pseudovibrio sp. Tun.PSC04-5.I4]SDR15434.1 hypothetical protein SAMN04515695_3052 [Pseudovibrio sp. Tun.PSC04-5.I4]
MSRITDGESSSPFKRGTITKHNKGGRAQVEFQDEDGNASAWLSVSQRNTKGQKSYDMPAVGTQVWCLLDAYGEDGVIGGAVWSDEDAPPSNDPNIVHEVFGPLEIFYNKTTGEMKVKGAPKITFEADLIELKGTIKMEGDSVTHNRKEVGETHKHKDVTLGPAQTGVVV